MDRKTIDNIVWWIPFRKLRNSVREVLNEILNMNNDIRNIKYSINNRESVSNQLLKPIIENIEIQLVDHCNLNCKGCSHFCTLAPESFLDINEFINDIKQLSSKISLNRLRLMGGEPLLHPDIIKFIEQSRKYFNNTDIRIVTNGILLPKMSESFFYACRENNIQLDITKYPPFSDKFSHYLDLCDKYRVKIGNIHVANEFFYFLNPKGDLDMKKTFEACTQRNCKNLRNSKIAICPMSVYIDFYNKYFNTNIPVDEGIDIYSHSAQEIVDYFSNPVATCKFCFDQSKPLVFRKWERTSLDKDEWSY